MRRLPIAFACATTLLLVLTAATSLAAPRNQAIGDRLNLITDETFPASTPFHINHGFAFVIGDNTIGLSKFELDMDGTPLTADFIKWAPVGDGITVSEFWYYNFSAGMTGVHTFTRHYFQACDDNDVPCDGARINTPVELFTVSTTVTFTP